MNVSGTLCGLMRGAPSALVLLVGECRMSICYYFCSELLFIHLDIWPI
jgi:hypothetical protein